MKPKFYALTQILCVILTSLFLCQSAKAMAPAAAAAAASTEPTRLTDAEITKTLTLIAEIDCTRKTQERIDALAQATQQTGLSLIELARRYQAGNKSTINNVIVKTMIIFLLYRDKPIKFNHELFEIICNSTVEQALDNEELIEALLHNVDPNISQKDTKQIVAWLSLQNKSKRMSDIYLNEVLLLLELKTMKLSGVKIDRRSSLLLYAATKGAPDQILPIFERDPNVLTKLCTFPGPLYNKTPLGVGEDFFCHAIVLTAQNDPTHPCYIMRYIRTCLELRKAKALYDQRHEAFLNDAMEEFTQAADQQKAEKVLADQRREILLNKVTEDFFTAQHAQTQRQQEHAQRQQADQDDAAIRRAEKEREVERHRDILATWKQSINTLIIEKKITEIEQAIDKQLQNASTLGRDFKQIYLETVRLVSQELDELKQSIEKEKTAQEEEQRQKAADAQEKEKEARRQQSANGLQWWNKVIQPHVKAGDIQSLEQAIAQQPANISEEAKKWASEALDKLERKKATQGAPIQLEEKSNTQEKETTTTAQKQPQERHNQQNSAAAVSTPLMPKPRSTTTGQQQSAAGKQQQQNHAAPKDSVPPVSIEVPQTQAFPPVDWGRLVEERRQIIEAQQKIDAAEAERKRQVEEAQRQQAEAEEERQISEAMQRLNVGRPKRTLANVQNVEALERDLKPQREAIRRLLRAKKN